jgi:hypothetical protein
VKSHTLSGGRAPRIFHCGLKHGWLASRSIRYILEETSSCKVHGRIEDHSVGLDMVLKTLPGLVPNSGLLAPNQWFRWALLVHETELIIYTINKHILFPPSFAPITLILRLGMRSKPRVEEIRTDKEKGEVEPGAYVNQ